MPNNPIEQIRFPERRSNRRALWSPVYIEPVVGSGERLCVGVVVAGETEHLVVPVPALERLSCLYGDAATSLSHGAALALHALGNQMAREGEKAINALRVPVDGIFFGPVRRGAGESLADVARTALLQSASLVEKAIEEEETPEVVERTTLSTRRLEQLVQDVVVNARPDLARAFRKTFQVTPEARPMRLGFVGQKLAANFGLLVPGPLSTLVNNAKAKLWDLEQLRTGTNAGMFASNSHMTFELLVHRVEQDAPQYSTQQLKAVDAAVLELETEADKVDIRCRAMFSPRQIADSLLLREAA